MCKCGALCRFAVLYIHAVRRNGKNKPGSRNNVISIIDEGRRTHEPFVSPAFWRYYRRRPNRPSPRPKLSEALRANRGSAEWTDRGWTKETRKNWNRNSPEKPSSKDPRRRSSMPALKKMKKMRCKKGGVHSLGSFSSPISI